MKKQFKQLKYQKNEEKLIISFGVYAVTRTVGIDVTYRDIKVYMDDRLLSLTDANGTIVEPFAYQGTTYLPVRAGC